MAAIYGGIPCVDPATFRRECLAAGLPLDPWWGRANGFDLNPIGKEPGKGWVLLTRSDLDSLDLTTDHTLTFSGETAATAVSLASITFLSAQCCSPGAEADPAAVYLCTLTDPRYFLGKTPVNTAYNVVSADGTGYLTQTKNGGSAWTWQQVVQDLATALGIGTQTLPFTPDGTPENLSYWGGDAWESLHDVLARLACGLRYNPTAGTFSVVRLGLADSTASAALATLDATPGRRTWDAYPEDPVRAWRPEKVRVQFLRRPAPIDGTSPYYTVDVTLAATAGVKAGTYVTLDDDAAALAATGTPSNSAALATRAAERAADWLRKRGGYERPVLKVYRDFLPGVVRDVPGATVGQVQLDDRGGAMSTHVAAKPDGLLEAWKPLSQLPPWFPPESAIPVEITGVYNATTGYPWKRLDLDYPTPGFLDASPAATGTKLFEVDGYQGFVSTDRVLMWPDADGDGWQCQRPGFSPLTTKGDLWGFSTLDARIPVGTNTYVLTADSAEALGVKWSAVGGSGIVDGDYGDITVSGAATVWTIDDDVVSDAKLRNSAALSVIGRASNSTGDPADIAAGTDAYVLRRSGSTLGFGQVATGGITDAAVTDAKLRDSAALSVIGRSANSTGVPADIAAPTDDYVLRRSGTTLAFGRVATGGITDSAVTYAKIQNVSATYRLLGRYSSGAGVVEELTPTQSLILLGYPSGTSGAGASWVKVTKTYADLAAASTLNDIEVYSLPTAACLHAAVIRGTTTFTGGAISAYSISVGRLVSGSPTTWAGPLDGFGLVPDSVMGVTTSSSYPESFSGTTSVRLYAQSSGADLDQATAGSVNVWLLVSQLP